MSELDTLRRGLDPFPGEKDAPPLHARSTPCARAAGSRAGVGVLRGVGEVLSCPASHAASASVSGRSMRSIMKTTGRVPSLQQAIITRSSLVQPCMMEPPCSTV